MNEEERRFKVKSIEKYNSQISTEDKKITRFVVATFLTANIALLCFTSRLSFLPDTEAMHYVTSFMGKSSLMTSILCLKNMITAISKKTLLESKIEDLKEIIESYDSENKKPKGVK